VAIVDECFPSSTSTQSIMLKWDKCHLGIKLLLRVDAVGSSADVIKHNKRVTDYVEWQVITAQCTTAPLNCQPTVIVLTSNKLQPEFLATNYVYTKQWEDRVLLLLFIYFIRVPWSLKIFIALNKLECGPMPNVMVALPNIGGALCSTPQSLARTHCSNAVQ